MHIYSLKPLKRYLTNVLESKLIEIVWCATLSGFIKSCSHHCWLFSGQAVLDSSAKDIVHPKIFCLSWGWLNVWVLEGLIQKGRWASGSGPWESASVFYKIVVLSSPEWCSCPSSMFIFDFFSGFLSGIGIEIFFFQMVFDITLEKMTRIYRIFDVIFRKLNIENWALLIPSTGNAQANSWNFFRVSVKCTVPVVSWLHPHSLLSDSFSLLSLFGQWSWTVIRIKIW